MSMPAKASAGQIKSFVYAQRWGVLATHSRSQQGFPFGSVVPYDLDSQGRVSIYISLIAEHFKNLAETPEASLTIIDAFGVHDPQAHARACLLVRFEKVPESECEMVQKSYERRFPNSINYEIAHNFLFMRGKVERIRWIGGFGDIQWLSQEQYLAASADPLAYTSWEVIDHMNEDHEDALRDLVAARQNGIRPAKSIRMVSLSAGSFTVRAGRDEDIVIPFVRPVQGVDELREVMIETLRGARRA